MFHQFSATAESLSKASSLVLRIGTDAHLYDDPDDVSIGPLLESRFDSEKVDALKRLLALLAQGSDVSQFFPQVVKNVASQSLELKKLVYLYLLHYAEKRQNEALLSINCFQKDLSDTNPLVRAWALRTMAGIRLHAVAPLVLRAITKCARDPSAYVRKCAAYALPKLYDLHHDEDNSSFEELVDILLNDHSPGVVGAAAAAFKSVCPSSLFLIAKSFRRLCEILPDVEEWGQIVLIEILLRYIIARHGIVKESIMFSLSTMSTTPVADGFPTFSGTSGNCQTLVGTTCDVNMITLMCKSYIDGQIECFAQTGCSNSNDDKLDLSLTSSTNDDVVMLLRCTSPLLWSHNSAVVLAAAGVHWIMAPRENIERIIKPLLFILRSCQASKYVILCNLLVFAKAVPPFFSQYYEDFFVCSYDTYQIRALKLEILSIIATESSIPIILQEFQDYVKDPDRRFVADTVAAIGLCAQRLPMVASACLEGLLAITFYESSLSSSSQIDGEAGVLVQAIMSIKAIIKQNPDSYDRVIVQLACNLDRIKIPAARALVIWIIGEYSVIGQIIPKVVPSILNYLAWSFTSEEPDTKLQILNTAAKVLLCAQGADSLAFRKILSYFIELAKYDINYDVRDRAHFIFKFMPHSLMTSSEKDNNSDISQNGRMHHEPGGKILNGKMHSSISSTKSSRIYLPGSLSQIVLHAASGYEPLPKPCSLLNTDLTAGVVNETNDSDISSGSSIEESGSVYDSDHSSISSDDGNESVNDSNDTESTALAVRNDVQDVREKTLVDVSNVNVCVDDSNENTKGNLSAFISTDLAELMPKLALESWLDEEPGVSSIQTTQQASSGRISINNLNCTVTPKLHSLLDPTTNNGLRVEYAFSYEISTISSMLVLVEIFFENCSSEPIKNIALKDGESSLSVESSDQVLGESESLLRTANVPPVLSTEEIASLDPGQRVKKLIEIRFPHHLLPLKLAVTCNGKKFSTKLWPDIGYFLKPLSMNTSAFIDHERQLPGMFEYSKRCTFKDHIEKIAPVKDDSSIHSDKIILLSQILASKVLSNCNVSLVCADIPVSFNIDDASGLCLRFSGELLSNSKPCLISILVEGKFSEPLVLTVKINCEETVFGLNLLNRVAAFLQ
ncbi:AP3-complex subunit beta-A-like isoform X1 [Zingiber officinale]|uniref:AP3-complex subunit beta-A-like isoform X1 n=2 Tax=Zingiber officinale TaxID=94328 RepID=UPI001C4D15DC|nr:AP3-complex subunit beta-A-like isoform X1 [Zingiber officinale]